MEFFMQTKLSTKWELPIHLYVDFVKFQRNPLSIYIYTTQYQVRFGSM